MKSTEFNTLETQQSIDRRQSSDEAKRLERVAKQAGKVTGYVLRHIAKGETRILAKPGILRPISKDAEVVSRSQELLAENGIVTSAGTIHSPFGPQYPHPERYYLDVNEIKPREAEQHSPEQVDTRLPQAPENK